MAAMFLRHEGFLGAGALACMQGAAVSDGGWAIAFSASLWGSAQTSAAVGAFMKVQALKPGAKDIRNVRILIRQFKWESRPQKGVVLRAAPLMLL